MSRCSLNCIKCDSSEVMETAGHFTPCQSVADGLEPDVRIFFAKRDALGPSFLA